MRDRLQVNVVQVDTCTGISQQCPPPTIKVEKVNGGLRLFGVVIGNNCQVSLPAFGVLFSFIGIILSIVAFKEPDIDENPLEISNREETVRNIRILGPVCFVVGVLMIILGVTLKYLSRKAQDKETKIGFYCPVHGDFYPLSPNINPRKYSFSEIARTENNKWWSSLGCLKKNHQSCEPIVSADIPPCPHSISPSNRSSFDGQHVHISNLNPNTIIITAATTPAVSSIRDRDAARSGSMASDLDAETTLQNQSYTSTRSLSVPNDVASFPSFRSRSNPPTSPPSPIYTPVASTAKRLSCPILPEIGAVSPLQILKRNRPASILTNPKTELKIVQPAVSVTTVASVPHSPSKSADMSISSDDESKKRKSVSILLPDDQYGVN
ncbi:uncharacterized protein LOC135843633 isoform X2 [Planococcus citri]|uniref:uncharacterized protein LOC135843633 isoform X2 n=1 Tax=Planococcus citri TaxID=170843 RepID=UPI0031FA3ABE